MAERKAEEREAFGSTLQVSEKNPLCPSVRLRTEVMAAIEMNRKKAA